MPIAELAGGAQESCRTFVFTDEGHTLGNALRCIISNYPNVQFCGYTIPTPSENKMNLRIQMTYGKAIDALRKGLEDLVEICNITEQKFDKEFANFKTQRTTDGC